jgi:hypothetical protein
MKIRQNIKEIETNIPTSKTVNKEKCKERFRYVLDHLPVLFEFYSFKSARFRFHDYQGKQRSNAEMANILINGGKKYNPAKRKNTKKNRKNRKKRHKDKRTDKNKRFVQQYIYISIEIKRHIH